MLTGTKRKWPVRIAGALALLGMVALGLPSSGKANGAESAQSGFPKIAEPRNLGDFVRDRTALTRLGKVLFWDMQMGSDGIVSCATCHSHAFSDHRTKNQLHPGPNGRFDSGHVNSVLQASDFPIRSDDAIGSQGVIMAKFVDIVPGQAAEVSTAVVDPIFRLGNRNVRQVTGKNAPSSIHAAFNHRNFWNGRASNLFNGTSPFGSEDPGAAGMIWKVQGSGVAPTPIAIEGSAAASQAVGPANNSVEMAYSGRSWPKIAKKLLFLTPLGKQVVHPSDSTLGSLSRSPSPGLNQTYLRMMQDAFDPQWWNSPAVFGINAAGKPVFLRNGISSGTQEYSLAEINFSLFWGLAVQAYESTLVADDTPLDHFLHGIPDAKFGALEQQGLAIFNSDQGRCVQCHTGALMTSASAESVALQGRSQLRTLRDGGQAYFDTGFFNIGVRPTSEDAGIGGKYPTGSPLNYSSGDHPGQKMAVEGAFKVPGLRNEALTGPYFHNGGKGTLEQVLQFYHDRGDFRSVNRADVDSSLERMRIGGSEQRALVAFIRNGLTDSRVANESAPFDHPELLVPNGHLPNGDDDLVRLPPIGAAGRSAEGLPPLKPFLE